MVWPLVLGSPVVGRVREANSAVAAPWAQAAVKISDSLPFRVCRFRVQDSPSIGKGRRRVPGKGAWVSPFWAEGPPPFLGTSLGASGVHEACVRVWPLQSPG